MAFYKLGIAEMHRRRFVEFFGTTGLRLLPSFLNTFATPFRKGVFECSLARVGIPLGSNLLILVIVLVPFWHRKLSLSAKHSFFFVSFNGAAA